MIDIKYRYLMWKMVWGRHDQVEDDGSIHDDYRINYHRSHIKSLMKAREEGVNIFWVIHHGHQLI